MGFIFNAITWISGWISLAAVAVSLSAGLYVACDLAEEHSSVFKKYLQKGIWIISLLHILFLIDGLPFKKCMFGFITHISYLSLLSTFPYIRGLSLKSIGTFAFTMINHFMWFNYFIAEYHQQLLQLKSENYYRNGSRVDINKLGSISLLSISGFLFVFVWLIPIGFFISLTSEDEYLPMANNTSSRVNSYHHEGNGDYHSGRKKKGIFKGMIDSILERKNQIFPPSSVRKNY